MGIGNFFKGLFGKRDSVTITKEQAELMQQLLAKEQLEQSMQLHAIADQRSLEGETVPVSSIFIDLDKLSPEERAKAEEVKQELLDKHGENMPVNTAHRITRDWDCEEKTWSDRPGCWEKQLRYRDGSLLYPASRRIVVIKEILEARKKDIALQEELKAKFSAFSKGKINDLKKNNTADYLLKTLRETMDMLEEMAFVEGDFAVETIFLEGLEKSITEVLYPVMSDKGESLKLYYSGSSLKRIPFFAQIRIIPEIEAIPMLLSEDLGTIHKIGYMDRKAYGDNPDYRPNAEDIRKALDDAVERGFSKKRAGKIFSAWAGYE